MTDMIERMARTIDSIFPTGIMGPGESIKAARAILEAMREPTQKMIEAPYGLRCSGDDFIHKSIYQAMINEAIEEEEPFKETA